MQRGGSGGRSKWQGRRADRFPTAELLALLLEYTTGSPQEDNARVLNRRR